MKPIEVNHDIALFCPTQDPEVIVEAIDSLLQHLFEQGAVDVTDAWLSKRKSIPSPRK